MKNKQLFNYTGKCSAILCLILFFNISYTFSQVNEKITIDKSVHTIYSKVLEEDRNISVYTISKNQNLDSISHTIYLLDGNDEFNNDIVEKLRKFVQEKKLMAGIILVAIENVDRVRDMSPVKTSFCDNPGAGVFLNCIENEIIPYVNSNYKKTPFDIIAGQSYSSVFVAYVLLEKPELFNGYVATSLYFPQSKDFFLNKVHEVLTTQRIDDRFLFISRGEQDHEYNRDGITERALSDFIGTIHKYGKKKVRLNYKVYENYGHCPDPSFIDGIQWTMQEIEK